METTTAEGKGNVSFEGTIVETFEKRGTLFAKIHITGGYADIPIECHRDAHLGDKISVDGSISCASIITDLSTESRISH